MAALKNVVKKTYCEALVKVTANTTADTSTITLATDLLAASEQLITTANGYPATIAPLVNIAGVVWTGAANTEITIVRNSIRIFTLQANAAGFLDFGGQLFPPDSIQNDQNIVVTFTGQGEVWLRLRKVAGYKSTDALSIQNS